MSGFSSKILNQFIRIELFCSVFVVLANAQQQDLYTKFDIEGLNGDEKKIVAEFRQIAQSIYNSNNKQYYSS